MMKSKTVLLLAALIILTALTDGQAQQVVLTVVDGFGYPNSNGNIVHIDMENMGDEVAAFQFDLHFDTSALSVTDVEKTYRSLSLDLFAHSNIAEGIRVVATGINHFISPDTGPIAQLMFSVNEGAGIGAYTLHLSNLVFADPRGFELTTATEDGTFLVSEGTTLQVVGTTGSPGSEENEVSLSLHNETVLSELSLVLNFDPDILSLTDVVPTDRTEDLSQFDWSLPATGELNLSIRGSEGQIIPSGYGPVAHLHFSVATEVESGQYPLTLSDVVAKNSTGEAVNIYPFDGFFTVHGGIDPDPTQETVLSVGEGSGPPNSSGNIVDIHLENKGDQIAAFQFDLHFDTNALSVTDIERTSRASSMDIFNYSNIGGGIRVAATSIGIDHSITPGTGTIAQLIFEVSAEASPGEYPLVVSDAIFADPLGVEIEATTNDGTFFITGGTSLRVIGTWGSAGSENNEVPLSLYNETALSELSLTFSFDPGILILTDILPTDRTEELSYFDWNLPDSGQVSLSIRGSAEQVISSGNGPVAIFYFSVATEVYTGQYPLALSNVTAQDSSGETVDISSFDGTFTVHGGIEPDIDLSATSYDFSEVEIGDTASWDLTIYNRGTTDLEIETMTYTSYVFNSLEQQFDPTIPPGDSLIVTVIFTPQYEGRMYGSLNIISNDLDEPKKTVTLRGCGIPEQKVLISVQDQSGYPGQRGLSTEVWVANPLSVSECAFTIHYDTTFMSSSDVVRSSWGEEMSTFLWSEFIPGEVMVSLADTTGKLVQPTEAVFLLFHFDMNDSV